MPEERDDTCLACRGAGKVISTLGGERREVECPWCEGTGKWIGGHDAQARWRKRRSEEPPPAVA